MQCENVASSTFPEKPPPSEEVAVLRVKWVLIIVTDAASEAETPPPCPEAVLVTKEQSVRESVPVPLSKLIPPPFATVATFWSKVHPVAPIEPLTTRTPPPENKVLVLRLVAVFERASSPFATSKCPPPPLFDFTVHVTSVMVMSAPVMCNPACSSRSLPLKVQSVNFRDRLFATSPLDDMTDRPRNSTPSKSTFAAASTSAAFAQLEQSNTTPSATAMMLIPVLKIR
mmetsp:Transcript_54553/g.129574  ORF Transcript_54553/g.129574 Transcript_54553/m.129574 type:complete len:228 (-) Transcript_54553:1135-1818(-)